MTTNQPCSQIWYEIEQVLSKVIWEEPWQKMDSPVDRISIRPIYRWKCTENVSFETEVGVYEKWGIWTSHLPLHKITPMTIIIKLQHDNITYSNSQFAYM